MLPFPSFPGAPLVPFTTTLLPGTAAWVAPAGCVEVNLVGQGAPGVSDFVNLYDFARFIWFVGGGSGEPAFDGTTFDQINSAISSLAATANLGGTDLHQAQLPAGCGWQLWYPGSPSSGTLPAQELVVSNGNLAYNILSAVKATSTLLIVGTLAPYVPGVAGGLTGTMQYGTVAGAGNSGYNWVANPGPVRSSGPASLLGQPTNGAYNLGGTGAAATLLGVSFPGGGYTGVPTTVANPGVGLPALSTAASGVRVVPGASYPVNVPPGGFIIVHGFATP
jgi:hypothetical protein